MGKVFSVTKFDFPAPAPDMIARRATEICGLPVRYKHNEHTLDEVHEFSGTLHFECFPEDTVELCAYQQGAVKRFEEKMGRPDHPARLKARGHSDADGVQRVYLDSYIGCELTLFHVTELALLRLGGSPERPDKDLAKYDAVLTFEELQARFNANREFHRKNRPWYVLGVLLMVLTLPFHMLWAIISTPFKLFRLRKEHPELFRKPDRGPE
jgi:hypothetical protein